MEQQVAVTNDIVGNVQTVTGAMQTVTAAMLAACSKHTLFGLVAGAGGHRVRSRAAILEPGITFGVVSGDPTMSTLA